MLLKNGKRQLAEVGVKMQITENKRYLVELEQLHQNFPIGTSWTGKRSSFLEQGYDWQFFGRCHYATQ